MNSILEFLDAYEEIEILIFDEDMIFNKPIEVYISFITLIGMAQM